MDSSIHTIVTTFLLVLHSNVMLITGFIYFDSEYISIFIIYLHFRLILNEDRVLTFELLLIFFAKHSTEMTLIM